LEAKKFTPELKILVGILVVSEFKIPGGFGEYDLVWNLVWHHSAVDIDVAEGIFSWSSYIILDGISSGSRMPSSNISAAVMR